jgi:hypothetical protein
MSNKAYLYNDSESLIHEGWTILRENLGIQKATQFIVLIERGKGDSVKEIAEYWGDASIDEIHDQVMEWKATRRINRR